MNAYRVDRMRRGLVPCGMNSIRYLGDSLREADRTYDLLVPGFDAWDQPDASYGVVLSRWDGNDYVPIRSVFLSR